MAKFDLERVNALWFFTLGFTSLAAGILIYILLIESALGAFSIHQAAPGTVTQVVEPKVALLRSEYTRQAHQQLNPNDDGKWIDVTIRSWREFLLDKSRKISFSEISDAQVEAGQLDAFDTLILPSVRAMSDEEIDQIKKFMERGGSVLATWTPGVFFPDGTWRGWRFIEEAFGVTFVEFAERGTGNYRVYQDTFPGMTPPGLYRPSFQPAEPDSSAPTRVAAPAPQTDFAPLGGYRWVGDLETLPPQSDYALADTLTLRLRGTDGEVRRQPAVAVSYYTWVGGSTETQMPYPYTGSGIRRFTLRGGTPITANIPSGYRVKIQVYNPGVQMRVVEPRTIPVGFWYDFAMEDRVVSEALANTTGIVYGTYGKGRFVYMGFQRDAMGVGREDREDYAVLSAFFTNVIRYLRREPIIWVHEWPYPYEAAAVLTGVAGEEAGNLAGIADILARADLPGTYFVQPERVVDQRPLMQRLYASGDVGVLASLMRDADGTEAAQTDQLLRLKRILESIVGGPVLGYKSTQRGRFDDNTMGALKKAGYRYVMPDSIDRRTVPVIMGYPFETLTSIGITTRLDEEIFAQTPNETTELRGRLFVEDINRIKYEGGLYNLTYSSDLLGRPENRRIMQTVVRELKEQKFWIQSADEITHWWRLHHGLNVDVEQRGPHRIVMRVSNNNGDTAQEMTVSIALGRPVETVRIQPELIGVPIPDPVLRAGNTELVLKVEQLKPQQNRVFHIDLIDQETNQLLNQKTASQ